MDHIHKNLRTCVLFFTICGLLACNDELNGNGTLVVTLKYKGSGVSRATVYLNKDSLYLPEHRSDEFDKSQKADAAGTVSFGNLPPGKYFIYAKGNEINDFKAVWAIDSIIIKKRFRQNDNELILPARLK